MRRPRPRTALAILSLSLLASSMRPPAAGAEEQRLIRQERSTLREIAELPADALDLLVWPVKRGVIWAEEVALPERVFDLLYFNEERTAGWSPDIDIGGEISGYGAKVFHNDLAGNGERISLGFLLDGSEIEEQRVELLLDVPELASTGLAFRTSVFYQEDEREDFYARRDADGALVPGMDTGPDDVTTYELDIVTPRVELAARIAPQTLLGVEVLPIFAKSEPSEGASNPIPPDVPGVDERVFLLGGGLFLELDRRNSRFRPKQGLYGRLDYGYFEGLEGEGPDGEDFRFSQYRAEIQAYVPVFRDDRSLVLRALLNRVERAGGDAEVPFWWLPKLDEDNGLRGFERNRFRDDGALLVNLEYRWPIWDTWDAYVFLDEGQVFDDYSELALNRFEWSAGGGLLLARVDGFLARVEYAVSDEDSIFSFTFRQAF